MLKKISFFLLYIFLFIPLASQAAQRPVDLVLVLDESGSMDKTDPAGARRDAASLFIMLCGPAHRVGLMGFGTDVRNLAEPDAMGPGKGRNRILKQVKEIGSGAQFTNVEKAIRRARDQVLLLDGKGQKPRRAILLLTDGKVDLGDPAADEASQEFIRGSVTADLIEKGIEVYCIAYSPQADSDLLGYIARSTGGLCVQGDNPSDLQNLFVRLFEELTQPQTLPFEGNQVLMDSDVQEATFVIAHSGSSNAVQLVQPDGVRLEQKQPGQKAKWFGANGYDLITVTRPMQGNWRVEPFAEGGNNRVMVLTNLELVLDRAPEVLLAGDDGAVAAKLVSHNNTVQAPEVLQTLQVRAAQSIASVNTASLSLPPLQSQDLRDDGLSEDGGAHDGVFGGSVAGPVEAGSFDLEIVVQAPTFQRRILRKVNVIERWFQVQMDKETIQPGEALGLKAVLDLAKAGPAASMRFEVSIAQPDGTRFLRAMQMSDKGESFLLSLDDLKDKGNYEISVTGFLGKNQAKMVQSGVGPLDLIVRGDPISTVAMALPPPEAAVPKMALPEMADAGGKKPVAAKRKQQSVVPPTAGGTGWILAGILTILILIAVQLSILIARKPVVISDVKAQPVPPRSQALKALRDEAERMLKDGELPGESAKVGTPPLAAAAALGAVGGKTRVAEKMEPVSALAKEVLVAVPDPANSSADGLESETADGENAVAESEIAEALTEDEENLLAEIMNEGAEPKKELVGVMAEGTANDQTSDLALEQNEQTEPATDVAGSAQPQREFGKAEDFDAGNDDLLAEFADSTNTIPMIPDEDDDRSDDDIIDGILSQVGSSRK